MGRFGLVLAPALVLVALTGCGSGHKKSAPTTSTSSSSVPPQTIGTEPPSTTTSSAPAATTTPTTRSVTSTSTGSRVTIGSFVISPSTPVCNSPTEIQLSWIATGATSVDLLIDGAKFSSFPSGPQTHLEYFACDGKTHIYKLVARAGTNTASVGKSVSSVSP